MLKFSRRKPLNAFNNRRRSRSWQLHARQLERCGQQKGLPPVYRGKRWQRRLTEKQCRLGSTSNAPATYPANTSTNSNRRINFESLDQQRQQNSAPLSSDGKRLMEQVLLT